MLRRVGPTTRSPTSVTGWGWNRRGCSAIWRYVGHGGDLAVAFVALGFRVRAGVAYGLFVCGGLLFTLVVLPHGQEMLFPLTGPTVVMAVGGHVIYGAVLGWVRSDRRLVA